MHVTPYNSTCKLASLSFKLKNFFFKIMLKFQQGVLCILNISSVDINSIKIKYNPYSQIHTNSLP